MEHKRKKADIWGLGKHLDNNKQRLFAVAMAILMLGYSVVLPAFPVEAEAICGLTEHTHTNDCYAEEKILICTLDEDLGHIHDDSCYEFVQVQYCSEDETPDHSHNETCYQQEQIISCNLEESAGHVHNDECYQITSLLNCSIVEHSHSADCYAEEITEAQTETNSETEPSSETEKETETEVQTEAVSTSKELHALTEHAQPQI